MFSPIERQPEKVFRLLAGLLNRSLIGRVRAGIARQKIGRILTDFAALGQVCGGLGGGAGKPFGGDGAHFVLALFFQAGKKLHAHFLALAQRL